MKGRDGEKLAVDAVTELIVEVFRLNGSLIEAGNDLVKNLGLTSARWQLLGAIDVAGVPLPVAHVARNMGLARQGVQRLAQEMANDGLLRFEPNPHHRRAKLVVMTPRGRETFRAAMALQRKWAAELMRDNDPHAVAAAAAVLRGVRAVLEA